MLMQQVEDLQIGGWCESIEVLVQWLDSVICLVILYVGCSDGFFVLIVLCNLVMMVVLEVVFVVLYLVGCDYVVFVIGCWVEDVYFDGNLWYLIMLGFVEIYYCIVVLIGDFVMFEKVEVWMYMVQILYLMFGFLFE